MDTENTTFQGKDFSHSSLADQVFTNCLFKNGNFTGSCFFNTKFISCTFITCNLSLIKMDGCRFQEVFFKECKIIGADFFKCEKNFFSIKAENTFLQYCNFSHLPLKYASFKNCTLKECHFLDTLLIEANFEDSDLSGTIFHNSNLQKANFRGAKNYEIDPSNNKLKKAKFSLPEALCLLKSFDVEII